jgi:hypothetical protein
MPKLVNAVVYNMIDLLPLSFEFQRRSTCLMFCILNNSNSNMKSLFRAKAVARSIRDSDDNLRLEVPLTRSERERTAFSLWGCVLWHGIPADIRNASNLIEFRRLYTEYLFLRLSPNRDVNLNRKFYDFL